MIRTINLRRLVPSLLLPVLVGLGVSFFTSRAAIAYSNLAKPPFSPSSQLFSFVWSLLYIFIGVACYFFEESTAGGGTFNDYHKIKIRRLFLLALAANLLWPILFFAFSLHGLSLIVMAALFCLTSATAFYFYSFDKRAGYLLLPYLVWLIFTAYLNMGVVILN